jgi:transglutaminase-like putative cysteine protease
MSAVAYPAARIAAPASRVQEPLLAAVLRPLVYVGTALALATPLATWGVALSIAGGAGVGALAGRVLAGSRLRLHAIVLSSAALLALALLARAWLRDGTLLAAALGPATALEVASACGLGLGALAFAAGLRASTLRIPALATLEVALVGTAFAQLVAGHRGGAINRPFELADSTIAQGGDPTVALLGIGAFAAFVSAVLLLRERSVVRAALHVVLGLLLLWGVTALAARVGMPEPKVTAKGLGLGPGDGKPKPEQRREQRGGSGGRSKENDNERLEFRDDYDSEGKQVPLAVVVFHDDYSPPGGLYYFRQAAFSQFNGKRLVSATASGLDDDLVPGYVHEALSLPTVPNELGKRSRLDTSVAMLAEHNRPFALEAPEHVRPEQNPDPGRFRRAYRVTSLAYDTPFDELIGLGVGDPGWSEEQRNHYLTGPGDPRYLALAEKIASDLPGGLIADPVARAMSIVLWLGKQGTYSLKSGHASAEDPTADFLFGDLTGYCVHFAHAAAYLMRSLGIPARVGAGYAIEEAARQGGSALLLSGGNSHAWPEVFVSGVGWVVLDVSPARSIDPPPPPPDADLQRLLGEMARGMKPMPQGQESVLAPLTDRLARALRVLATALSWLVPLLLALGYGVKLWRRTAPTWSSARSAPRVVYRAALDRLREAALGRSFGESREAFARRVHEVSPSFGALTDHHVAARFGGRAARPDELRALSQKVERELAAHVPLGRRLLGALHPFSWLARG